MKPPYTEVKCELCPNKATLITSCGEIQVCDECAQTDLNCCPYCGIEIGQRDSQLYLKPLTNIHCDKLEENGMRSSSLDHDEPKANDYGDNWDTPRGVGEIDTLRHSRMEFPVANLENGRLPADSFKAGQVITYTGEEPSGPTINGISPYMTGDDTPVKIGQGFRLIVCKNQYINHEAFSARPDKPGEKVVLCHFDLHGVGHIKDCCCGSCGIKWTLHEATACNCTPEPPLDPGQQKCVIM